MTRRTRNNADQQHSAARLRAEPQAATATVSNLGYQPDANNIYYLRAFDAVTPKGITASS